MFNIIDLHCDTIMRFYMGEHLNGMENSHINLQKLIDGNVLAQCFAIFVPTGMKGGPFEIKDGPEAYFAKAYARYQEEMDLNSDKIARAFSVEDILANAANGKVSSVLTVEDAVTLDGKIERVDEYYNQGVRMAAILWNHENSLGYPNSMDPEEHARGLKPFGKEAVRRMMDLGIIVDVSHLNEGGFWDVYEAAKEKGKPFIASHSCARALRDHSRNLTDDQIRAIAETGGIIGINYLTNFLRPVENKEDNYTAIDTVIEHLLHFKEVGGIEILALGSDYDGMGSTLEWKDASGNPVLVKALEKAFTPEEIELITHGNALRVFKTCWGK